MTTNSSRLSGQEESDMAQRLQMCLGHATTHLYTVICDDRKILSDSTYADSDAFRSADERRRLYPVGELTDESLRRRLITLSQAVDHGFKILRNFGPTDGGAIADRFVEANQGLVGKVSQRYRRLDFLAGRDLKQIGQLGLCQATLRFNPESGKFSSFAFWWIKSFITRALTETGRLIRLPVATVRQAGAIDRTRSLFWQRHGRSPSLDELSAAVDILPSRLLEILPHMKRPGSLDARTSGCDDDSATSYDFKHSDALSPAEVVTGRQLSSVLEAHLSRLTPMERDIVICQLDLREDGCQESFYTLGERYSYSHEGIRKMYKRAIAKLKEWLGPDFCLE
jgi:RNA polymerase primary sigma factor